MRYAIMLGILLAGVSGCGSATKPVPASDPATRRTLSGGEIIGHAGDYGDHAWRGIAYAAAPVGALRWRAPQPPTAWSGTREALRFGSPCPQYASVLGGVPGPEGSVVGNEDCLFLNVYAPSFAPDAVPTGEARLPVMVWIHGGGNSIGEAGFFNGGRLAVDGNVIVVTINYRLGPLGWLRHAALRDGATAAEQSGNFALLDQIRALEWVRDNIAQFGGDPGNVTIFGESAGGRNVYALLRSPPAKGLFHRAIVQSGGVDSSDLVEAEQFSDAAPPGAPSSSNEALVRLLIADGSAADRAAAKARLASMPAADAAAYLRGESPAELLAAYEPYTNNGMIRMPQVFGDGVVLSDRDALQDFAAGDFNQVPVMVGTTRDENKLFMFGNPEYVQRILWLVPRLRDERMYNLTAEYLAKMWKAIGADQPAAALRGRQENVYVYRFDWDEEPTMLGADLGVIIGAAHGFEIPFVFGHFDLGKEGNVIFTDENEAGRKQLSQRMIGYWSEFARSGAPGRGRDGTQVEWQAWDPNQGRFIVLDTDAGGGVRMSTETVTSAGVIAALDADPRLADSRDRCTILKDLAKWSRGFDEQRYAARSDCEAFPLPAEPAG